MIHINKVGELTGVTVRTLRYYDKIGLLKPASKTEGGHRLYTNEEIKKLQQVQFLKKLDFRCKRLKICSISMNGIGRIVYRVNYLT